MVFTKVQVSKCKKDTKIIDTGNKDSNTDFSLSFFFFKLT